MALGKGRNNKRSSSTSYTSTITTIVFLALCVLGVWMLTSNSVIPPQTTTRTASNAATSNNNNNNDDDFSSSTAADNAHVTKVPTNEKGNNHNSFEDNPGDLPEDAIKSDEESNQKETKSENQKDPIGDTSMEATLNEKQPETGQGNGENKKDEEKAKDESSSSSEQNQSQGLQGKESVEEQEKQKELETQVSEESSTTMNQQAEQTSHDNQITTTETEETRQVGHEEISNGNQKSQISEPIQKEKEAESNENSQGQPDHHLSDEDQQQRTQQQQQQQQQQQIQQEESKTEETPGSTQKTEEPQESIQKTEEPQESIQKTDNNQESMHKTEETQESTEKTGETQESKQKTDETQESTQKTKQTQEPTQKAEESQDQQLSQQNESSNSGQETKQNQMDAGNHSKASNDQSFPGDSGIPKESKESKKAWSTQADQSESEKERRKDGSSNIKDASIYGYTWQLCNVTAGPDYIPCLDNEKALKQLHSTKHFEHRERHCPEEGPTCLVPIPDGYKIPIEWPTSRDKIWYHNVPHTKLAEVKGHQNWVKVTGEFLTFPGGGTQFIHGALHYVDFLQQSVPSIAWGKHTRVILDVGCGVASFGGFLFEKGVLAMSFAPKDEHEAQVQFAQERGIPAISAVMGSQRLPFPSRVFDLVHCARCRVPWHENGGSLLLELNRVLRPGGYFVWSATPVYQKLEEDVQIWKAMSSLTISMCWELITIKKDKLNSVGAAIYKKPSSNECYNQRKHNRPPMCKNDDDPNAAWYVPLQACMHKVPIDGNERGSQWPEDWPRRLQKAPYWLNSSQMGIYGKPAPADFTTDYEHWQRVVSKLYLNGLGISWSNVRNVMDMRAVYGGFAAALKDLKVWVFNVVNVDSPDTLPIIYERGLFGIYHDWCESFSTYPRSYDLLHADHLFSRVKKRCKIAPLMAEIDRIVRPGGKLIVRDESSVVGEVENMLKSLHWEVHLTFSKDQEGILSARKSDWRPDTYTTAS